MKTNFDVIKTLMDVLTKLLEANFVLNNVNNIHSGGKMLLTHPSNIFMLTSPSCSHNNNGMINMDSKIDIL